MEVPSLSNTHMNPSSIESYKMKSARDYLKKNLEGNIFGTMSVDEILLLWKGRLGMKKYVSASKTDLV
jgi:hypothetical protein